MSLRSKLKIENTGMLAALIFYAVVGIICFAILAINDFLLIHIGLIGILNLITAYGLFKKRAWTFWAVIALFFIATTFSASMLYYAFGLDLILDTGVMVYLVLTWIFTAYTATKRKTLQA